MGEDNENNSLLSDKAKILWKNLPLKVKLIIIGGIMGAVVILLGVSVVLGIIPSVFLDYSNDVQNSDDLKKEYEEYWSVLCEEGDTNCSEEQIKAAKELRESQEAFYKKFEKLSSSLDKKQKYLVLTTIFYGIDIESFTIENGAFDLDDTDEIDYETNTYSTNNQKSVYEREKDSIKELIKQFKVNTAICYYTRTTESGEDTNESYSLTTKDGKPFSFNFFDKVKVFLNYKLDDEEFEKEKEACLSLRNGTVKIEPADTTKASIEGFYKYLRESTYFDDKEHLSGFYKDYAKRNNLSDDLDTWAIEDKIKVRESFIEDIELIVEEYTEEKGLTIAVSSGSAYWWPIGSKDTTENGGKLFAKDAPEFTLINSPFGYRIHPISGIRKLHDGIDLHGIMGKTNIIASLCGEVVRINNTCASRDSNGCGGGYGNYVEIIDTKGNISIYAHMYKDSITVEKGDIVSQGQVIGLVGSSGNSTGAHLHFNIKVNGTYNDPLDYISAENPRPESGGEVNFNQTRYTNTEFIAVMKKYYSEKNPSKTGEKDFKNQILNNNGAEIIYNIGIQYNVNPEILVVRAYLEGYSPGASYNYYGYNCTNTGGLKACTKFDSFEAGVERFFKNISKYESVEAMMSRYAYLGDYWYTGNHSGLGGCYYAEYIYPEGVPLRIQEACAKPDGYCGKNNTANCLPTTEEDRQAYTNWQVRNMAQTIDKIFGSGVSS